ncbi:MAG: DUF1850 domain-containing protein [Syntrophales bacterium]|jgi:hypothetical protein|nr:DUF1850 domain-containing protein [Syntrophales bacterium]MDX9823274.1 DUF1850 domain-containing protein [Syntrophales bacterium]
MDGHTSHLLFSVLMNGLKRIMPAAIVTGAVGVIVFFWIPSQTVLVVTSASGKTALCARMSDGEEWMISYTHSVNRRPVYDFLRVEGNGLRILRSRYDAFGAGMPETSTPDNPLRVGPDGWLEYTVNRSVPDLTIFVGRVAGHALQIKGRNIPFISLAEPGKSLRFFVEKRSLYRTFKGGCVWK